MLNEYDNQPADLTQRRPVWSALSELFLDTDIAPTRHHIVQVLAASPYSIDELEQILIREVYPVCRGNLSGVAGAWSGFDEEWLENEILKGSSSLSKVWMRCLARLFVPRSSEWHTLKRLVVERRQ